MVAALLAVYKQSASSNRALTLGAATLSGKYVAVLTSVPILPPKVGRSGGGKRSGENAGATQSPSTITLIEAAGTISKEKVSSCPRDFPPLATFISDALWRVGVVPCPAGGE